MRIKLILLIVVCFSIPMISALDFDNAKSYNESSKEITITNAFGLGEDIAKIRLNTPIIYKVIRGKDRLVAEFTIYNYGDYDKPFKDMEFFNINDGMKGFDRKFEYRIKVPYYETIQDLRYICNPYTSKNFTEVENCTTIDYGTKQVTKYTYVPMNSEGKLYWGEVTIGVFTDVLPNDKVEWIPTFFGVRIDDWAVWVDSLFHELLVYYKFDDGSGTVAEDFINGTHNGTTSGNITWRATGKLGGSIEFDGVDAFVETANITGFHEAEWSACWWGLSNVSADLDIPVGLDEAGQRNWFVRYVQPDNVTRLDVIAEGTINVAGFQLHEWDHTCVGQNSTNNFYYINGTLQGSTTDIGVFQTGANLILGWSSVFGNFWNGGLDEFGYWNRSLTPSEIVDLFNNDIGITPPPPNIAPTVTSGNPANNTNFSVNDVAIQCTGNDTDGGVLNLSIRIDGVVNFTLVNSTANQNLTFNQTVNNFVDGSFLWDCSVSDRAVIRNSAEKNFTVDTTPPLLTIGFPTNITFGATQSELNYTVNDTTLSPDTCLNTIDNGVTNSSLVSAGTNFTGVTSAEGSNSWRVWCNDTLDNWNSSLVIFGVDLTPPVFVNLENQTVLFNTSFSYTVQASDAGGNFDSFAINNTNNFTIGQATGVLTNATNLLLGIHVLNITINDTFGNQNSSIWQLLVETGAFNLTLSIFNLTTGETKNEVFGLEIITNGSTPSNANLTYSGTTTAAAITNIGGDNYTIVGSEFDIPLGVGSNNWNIQFMLENDIRTVSNTQTVEELIFNLCNVTLNQTFINFTFVNETTTEEAINATTTMSWSFWLGSGVLNKTLSFSNATENPSYAFCANPEFGVITSILAMVYNNAESEQRTHLLRSAILTNATTNTALYLLPTSLGTFTRYQTVIASGDPISQALATVIRNIGGTDVTVFTGLTDSSGLVTMFLNPDVLYDYTFSAVGFDDNTFTLNPTSPDIYIVIMGGTVTANATEIFENTRLFITPENSTLPNNTVINFGFNISTGATITFLSMNLTNETGSQLNFTSSSGTNLTLILDTNNLTRIIGYFESRTSEENLTLIKTWMIGDFFEGDYSIFRQGRFFLNYDFDVFWRILLVIISISAILIFLSFAEAIPTNESKILVTILLIWAFSLVGWLNTGITGSATGNLGLLGQFSNQYGIAIVSSVIASWAIIRRLRVVG